MEYILTTYKNVAVKMSEDFSLAEYTKVLQNPEVNSVAIGNMSTLKSNIRFIHPVYAEDETPKGECIAIYTNGGVKPLPAYSEDYDSASISNQYNARDNSFILIGDTLINRSEYSMIKVATTEFIEEPATV